MGQKKLTPKLTKLKTHIRVRISRRVDFLEQSFGTYLLIFQTKYDFKIFDLSQHLLNGVISLDPGPGRS